MQIPVQPEYGGFISRFMRLLFKEDDEISLCCLSGANWSESFYTLDNAISWLLACRDTPNLYFRASAFGSSSQCTQDNCAKAQALFLDIDYGSAGHRNESPFKTLDDVVGYLLTMPLKPSIAWHTGHGVQCAFLLTTPCVFPAGNGDAGALAQFVAVGSALRTMAMADAAFTPEHAFRVPLTLNSKSHMQPGLEDIRGSLLWCDDHRQYTLDLVEAACTGYDIKEFLRVDTVATAADSVDTDTDDACACDYASLPADLRDEIEGSGSERSERLFSIIGRMIRAGYTDGFIVEAIGHGTDFVEKYSRRTGGLQREVETCAAKIRKGNYVYSGSGAPPVRVYNTPAPVKLDACAALSDAMTHMLERYAKAARITLLQRVRDAVRFHEHLSSTQQSCVMESPCGAGKSVWALCHIAVHADDGSRYVYVTETVDALYKAADILEVLTKAAVGRVHGFNADRCLKLSGSAYTWKQCIRGDRRSKCSACTVKSDCAYHTRDEQVKRPILCMTHAGFIRALEDGSGLLADAHVIVDEGLSPFDSWTATTDELRRITDIDGVPYDAIARLFPGTALAQAQALRQFDVADAADVYARRNYIYRDEAETSALQDLITTLGAALRTDTGVSGFNMADQVQDHERTRDVVGSIINFFRPSARADAAYAYRESRVAGGNWQITCKRNRFSFSSGGAWKSLYIMNASASLSPFPYPDNMPVFTCPDLPEHSGLVSLHLIKANPTLSKQQESVRIGSVALAYEEHMRRHSKVLVCLNRESGVGDDIEAQVKMRCGADTEVTVLTRGRIKGVNNAGDCTLALLQGMSLFTGIDDCALHAAIQYRRSFPDTPYVYTDNGSPNWPGGKMLVPAMRNYYALRCLDEIYQAIWRTAVRNDCAVEAVIVIPDPHWLAALYRTVMPEACIESAYVAKDSVAFVPTGDGNANAVNFDYQWDEQLYGMGICAQPAGTELTKAVVALALGYNDDDPATVKKPKSAWEKNKASIMSLVGELFDEAGVRKLKRKSRS